MAEENSGGSSGGAFVLQGGAFIGGFNYLFSDGGLGSQNITISGAQIPVTGQWNHIVFTYNGGLSWAYYLNGASTLTGSFSGSGINNINTAVTFGARTLQTTGTIDGRLAECGIWNVALVANEAAALAKGKLPKEVRPLSLKGYNPLWGIQSPEPDLSGNQNNGTLTGTAFATGPPTTLFTRKSRTPPDIYTAPTGINSGVQHGGRMGGQKTGILTGGRL